MGCAHTKNCRGQALGGFRIADIFDSSDVVGLIAGAYRRSKPHFCTHLFISCNAP